MFLNDLFEARQETAMQTLARYLVRPDMFVNFTNINRLGINPSTDHDSTPVGIYAYPLKYAYDMMEQKIGKFGLDRKFICLFEAHGNFLDLQAYTHDDYENDVAGLAEQWTLLDPKNQTFAMNMLVRWEDEMWQYDTRPGAAFWRLLSRVASRTERLYDRPSMFIKNSVLRKLGYDGVIDNEGSIIHPNEPTQALFLTRDVCRPIDFLINDHLDGIPPAFPQRGERKIKGAKFNPDEIDLPPESEY